ncbi:MAG: hypothetical protein U1F43_17950 [Myxococcota bacterium]
MKPAAALASCLLLACGKVAAPAPDASPPAALDDTAAAASADTRSDDAPPASADDLAPGPSPDATPGGPGVPGTPTTDCPTSLDGVSRGLSRVITKACGIVSVTGHYAIEGGTLTLEAGTTLAFKDGADLEVGGGAAAQLIVRGSDAEPVRLTAMGDKSPGAWRGVKLRAGAHGSSLAHLAIEFAGDEDGAALRVEADGVALDGVSVRGAKGYGIDFERAIAPRTLAGASFVDIGKAALRLDATAVGALGPGLAFAPGASLEVWGGSIAKAVTWPALGVPIVVAGPLSIDAPGALTLAPGSELRLREGAELVVGATGAASLSAVGSAEHPITLVGERDEAGVWSGITFAAHARDSTLAFVTLGGTKADRAAIQVKAGAVVRVSDVGCRKCGAATLGWECKAQLSQTNVKALDGTPTALAAPERCD